MNSLRTALKAYRRESLLTRLHVILRVLTCPFKILLKYLPKSGSLLDVGCGHGLLLRLLHADTARREMLLFGIDHDAEKIKGAQRYPLPNLHFSHQEIDHFPAEAFDTVSVMDVLYSIQEKQWHNILISCFRVLRPGGTMVVKEVIDKPRWKYLAIMIQEYLSVKVFGITKGDHPHFESAGAYHHALNLAGFKVTEALPLKTFGWISHYLIVARKPE